MKPEPLTEKKMKCVVSNGNFSFEPAFKEDVGKLAIYFNYWDVKSAVQWLLEEIEKERKEVKEAWHQFLRVKASETTIARIEGILDGLERVEDLIKKAFSGVLEEWS